MESDKHICVRQEVAGSKQVKISIVDLTNPAAPETHGINADAAILNPMTEIIALRGGSFTHADIVTALEREN